MPPKPKETISKKQPTQLNRPQISDSSLLYIPQDIPRGFQERLETGVDWTVLENAIRHHRQSCTNENVQRVTFSEALQSKIKQSILNGFLNEDSGLTLEQQYELLLTITLWDNEKFANDEAKTCFQTVNCITDDMMNIIKRSVKVGKRDVLRRELKMIEVLRVNHSQVRYLKLLNWPKTFNTLHLLERLADAAENQIGFCLQMTDLDSGLSEFKNLVTLNLCRNFISDFDAKVIPTGLRMLELQANRIQRVDTFAGYLPSSLIYVGLSRNLLTDDGIEAIGHFPYNLTVLDLSDNDIYQLEQLLNIIVKLPNLVSLQLAGNPCAMCAGYARSTLMALKRLRWLDSRDILPTDRSDDPFEPHPDDLRSTYFNFTVLRIMSAPVPPKPEKGATTAFYVECELPLLDATRRKFLMYRRHESLIETLPPPEDEDWPITKLQSIVEDKTAIEDEVSHGSDIYRRLTSRNSREISHYTTFESNRVQWSKVINFQEPTVRIFCPDLRALRDTFRTVITVRLIYSVTITGKQGRGEKKSAMSLKNPGEQRVTLATVRCSLKRPDWSQTSQHFHWDDSLGSNDAIHWGDGDLSVLQYSQVPVKPTKGKPETDLGSSRQVPPENFTCHFAFGIDTLRA